MQLNEKQRDLILSSFLFQGVPREQVLEELSTLRVAVFSKGEIVYTTNLFQKSVGIILAGKALSKRGESILPGALGTGSVFGVASLYNNAATCVTAIVAQTRCTIAFLTNEQLEKLFYRVPQVAVNYILFLTKRIHQLNRKIDGITAPTAEVGVALYLLDNQREGVVEVPGSYTQLAKLLGICRASLYRALDRLEEKQIIRRREKTIELLDMLTLKSLQTGAVSS